MLTLFLCLQLANAWMTSLQCMGIADTVRLGVPVCTTYRCIFGGLVDIDVDGLHGLICQKPARRAARHKAVNELIKCVLVTAKLRASISVTCSKRRDGRSTTTPLICDCGRHVQSRDAIPCHMNSLDQDKLPITRNRIKIISIFIIALNLIITLFCYIRCCTCLFEFNNK